MSAGTGCGHVIACAVTEQARAEVRRHLDIARRAGNLDGMLALLAMLAGPCAQARGVQVDGQAGR